MGHLRCTFTWQPEGLEEEADGGVKLELPEVKRGGVRLQHLKTFRGKVKPKCACLIGNIVKKHMMNGPVSSACEKLAAVGRGGVHFQHLQVLQVLDVRTAQTPRIWGLFARGGGPGPTSNLNGSHLLMAILS